MSQPPPPPYRLGETVGAGALASVVRVTDGQGRVFAGKVLHASHEQDEGAVARFLQEAELLEGLEHENLVRIDGAVDVDGRRVLLMELVEGPTLEQLIASEAPMGEERMLRLARGIAAGLARAHAAGIIHRDLKPSNVLVAGGHTPKIADFGMARATSLAGVDHNAFTVLGTPDYMAPECLDPLAVDPRTDLYALGCIMFEMASGQPPFGAATPFGLLEQHREAPVPALDASHGPGVRALVQALLAKSPADRPQAASTVVATIDQMLAGDTTALMPVADPGGGGRVACAACGQPLVLEVAICMNCGLVTAKVEPGGWTLLVAGPGEIGDKLDTARRERLVAWIRDNSGLRMDPGDLAKRIPRLPFTLATEISQASGRALVLSLRQMEIETELVEGSAWRSSDMRRKVKSLTGRALAIVAASLAGLMGQMGQMGTVLAVVLPLTLLGTAGVTFRRATKRLTTPAGTPVRALPAPIARSLRSVESALPAIDQGRHRHGLRAVVSRALQLSRRMPDDLAAGEELASAVELATVAASRLDALDRELAARELGESSPRARAMLHERDTWSARLLALTAQLDALAARFAAVEAGRTPVRTEEDLEQLRAMVEALEEVQGR